MFMIIDMVLLSNNKEYLIFNFLTAGKKELCFRSNKGFLKADKLLGFKGKYDLTSPRSSWGK